MKSGAEPGDRVEVDEPIAQIETDKVLMFDFYSVTGYSELFSSSNLCFRTNLMKLRSDYKDAFVEKHGVKLGLMSGFVKVLIRNADRLNFAGIEKEINNLAKKANNGTISIDEMAGGTFTISNGGVYGSLLSTPIINPPQVIHLICKQSR
ncbi:hypothetical protein BHM03_00011357, partial [Ensete ventricosum]